MNLTLGEILNMQSLAVAQCFRNGEQLLIFSWRISLPAERGNQNSKDYTADWEQMISEQNWILGRSAWRCWMEKKNWVHFSKKGN